MKLKVGYFADGKWSHFAFKKLIVDSEIEICFICVRYDTQDTKLKYYCDKYKIDYLKHKNINSEDFLEQIKIYQCDLFVSMSFNQIFKEKIINIPRYKAINCHAGKLPFYRGRNVLNWVLINDEKEFGITVHYIDQGIDTGDIILQRVFPISDNDTYATLLTCAYIECASILYEAIIQFKVSPPKGKKQVEINSIGFYCTQRKEGDEVLNWNQPSRDIYNFVRALTYPGPIARSYINGKEMKIKKVSLIKNAPIYKGISGAILSKENHILYVKTLDSFIKIEEYEYSDKVKVGDRFE
jgi:methionyl-tRNA formyltransferase